MKYIINDHTFVICAYKESEFLDKCVKSLISQSIKSRVIIATSTPNSHINAIAKKYGISVYVNSGEKGLGGDWNFAYSIAQSPLVTIAHQDDIYEPDYTKEMLECLIRSKNPILYFSSYYELRNDKKIYNNKLLKIKRAMLCPLRIKAFHHSKFIRRMILSFGCPICCPAVTFVKERVGEKPFTNDFLSNIDWQQWEIQSRKTGSFVYNSKPLMCHRIHKASTTTEIIGDSKRSEEDYQMFLKFWPEWIAKQLAKFYKNSEKSNEITDE